MGSRRGDAPAFFFIVGFLSKDVAYFIAQRFLFFRRFSGCRWLALFFGHGLLPQSWDPIADRVPQPEAVRQFQRILGFIREQVEGMSSHDAFIEVHAAPTFAQ